MGTSTTRLRRTRESWRLPGLACELTRDSKSGVWAIDVTKYPSVTY